VRAGAMGYIMKQEAPDHILTALRTVLAGRTYLSEKMTHEMVHRVQNRRGPDPGESSVAGLSNRELEVFELLGQGLATRVIAERLFLSVKTVETHLDHIKTKLGLATGHELLRRAMLWSIDNR